MGGGGAGYESAYYGINDVRFTKSERRNRDLTFIGPILNEIQPFKNSKITKKCMNVRPVCHLNFIVFKFYNDCILFNIGLMNTKLENFPNFNVLSSF